MSNERDILALQAQVKLLEADDRRGTWLDFQPAGSVQPFSASGTRFYAGLPRATVTPRRLRVWAFVATTNNGANFWTIDAQNSAGTSIASVTTGGGTPIAADTWTLIQDTTMSSATLTATTDKILQIVLTKTGAPGNLSITPMFYVL